MEFVHLHLHTQYSFLDGAIKIPELVKKLKNQGALSVAITDHGTMYGVVEFYRRCVDVGIKPIIGCEVYVSPSSRHDRAYSRGETSNYHLVLLAKNNKGLKSLYKLVSLAQVEGFYYKPRIDKEILREYSGDLIGLSACLGGEVPQKILNGSYQDALNAACEYRDILGSENYYLEIQSNGIADQKIVNRQLMNISDETGIPLVATNDCHYLNKGDHVSQQVLICVQTGTVMDDPGKLDFHSEALWVKSYDEMKADFADTPQALANTVKIAEKCNVTIEFGKLHFPVYEVPEQYTQESYFTHIANVGLHKRLGKIDKERHDKYYARLKDELKTIIDKDFAGYFLIVWDFVNYSKEAGIPVGPGRGSGAGSIVAYAMGITDVDPIKYDLLFERFLNPERTSMPDFDIDFCINGRDEVISYVRKKYGADRVAQIATFSKMLAKGVIRDVGRVLGVPLPIVGDIAKKVPNTLGITLEQAIEIEPELKRSFRAIPNGEDFLNHSLKLEGLIRQAGTHAAGIVISDAPMTEYAPISRGNGAVDDVYCQFEKDTLEAIGLIKFDFLGLANLTIIDAAVKLIKENRGESLDLHNIPYNDKRTYEILSTGNTTGVFQLESSGMRNLLRKLKPNSFEDIIAVIALYRPGPIGSGMLDDYVQRKHGEQKVEFLLPELEDILKETYGIIVYQEQVMQIAQVLGGYSLGAADILRRAMGKKKKEEMDKQKSIFLHGSKALKIDGAIKKGYLAGHVEEIFHLMEKFAEYGFNKSHSAAYAMIAYQTAYLKANYTVEYMTALLSCSIDNTDKVVELINDCKKMEIEVKPPDINRSKSDFTIDGVSIRFGLGAVKGVGFRSVDAIVEERDANGEYQDIYGFCERVDFKFVNKKVLDALIKAGAFDRLGKFRSQLLSVQDSAQELGQKKQKLKSVGIMTLDDFMIDPDDNDHLYYPDMEELPESELLKKEKEVLGFYISNHPLVTYSKVLEIFTTPTTELEELANDSKVVVGGIIKHVRHHITKRQRRMAFVSFEDLVSSSEVTVFTELYERSTHLLVEDRVVLLECTISKDGDENYSLLANNILDADEAVVSLTERVCVQLNLVALSDTRLNELKAILNNNGGATALTIVAEMPGKYKAYIDASSHKVSPSVGFFSELDKLLGEERYELIPHLK